MQMTQTLPPAGAPTGPGSTGTGWPAPASDTTTGAATGAATDAWGHRASDPWGAPPAPPLPPAEPTSQPQPRPRRRPGWGALVLASLGAAVLASGATAGTVTLLDRDATPAAVEQQAAPPVASSADGVDWTAVADAVSPSVVSIRVASQAGEGQGSGVVLDDQGHVLTNNHVATGAGEGAQIQVVLSDGRVFDDVRVVGLDPATDLAVLQIVDPPSDLVPATLGDSDSVVAGQPVMAVGNPLGLSDSVTTGIVSAVNRPVSTAASASPQQDPFSGGRSAAEPVVTNAIQTDAAVNPGNSGGALVDASGAVIGIPSSIASTATGTGGQAGSIGLGFAIPVNEAKRIADELVADGTADHAWLGVRLQDGAGTADGTTRQGAEVVDVTAGTPAADAGLQAGDVIVAVDDENVSGSESLTAQVRERAPGDEVTLHVVRGSELVQVQAVLGTRADS